MDFTSTDCNTVRMVDITGFIPGIGSPSTAISITLSPFMTEANASEHVEERDPSAAGAGGTGERRWKASLSRLISSLMILFKDIYHICRTRNYLPNAGMSAYKLDFPRRPSQNYHRCSVSEHAS